MSVKPLNMKRSNSGLKEVVSLSTSSSDASKDPETLNNDTQIQRLKELNQSLLLKIKSLSSEANPAAQARISSLENELNETKQALAQVQEELRSQMLMAEKSKQAVEQQTRHEQVKEQKPTDSDALLRTQIQQLEDQLQETRKTRSAEKAKQENDINSLTQQLNDSQKSLAQKDMDLQAEKHLSISLGRELEALKASVHEQLNSLKLAQDQQKGTETQVAELTQALERDRAELRRLSDEHGVLVNKEAKLKQMYLAVVTADKQKQAMLDEGFKTIADLEKVNHELQARVDQLSEEASQADSMSRKVEALKEKNAELLDGEKNLKKAYDELKQQLESALESASHREEVDQIKAELTSARQHTETLEATLREKEDKLQQLQHITASLSSAEARVKALESENGSVHAQLVTTKKELEARVKALESENGSVHAQLVTAKKELEQFKERMERATKDALISSSDHHKKELEAVMQQLKRLETDKAAVENNLRTVETSVQEKDQRISELTQQLKESLQESKKAGEAKDVKLREMEEVVRSLRQEVSDVTTKHQKLEFVMKGDLIRLQDELKTEQAVASQFRSDLMVRDEELKQLKSALADMGKFAQTTEKKISEQNRLISQLESQVDSFKTAESNLSQLHLSRDDLKKQMTNLTVLLSERETENNVLSKEKAAALEKLKSTKKEQDAVMISLKQELLDAKARAVELATEVKRLEAEKTEVQSSVDTSVTQVEKLDNQLKTIKSRLSSAEKSESTLKQQVGSLQEQLHESEGRKRMMMMALLALLIAILVKMVVF